MTSELTKRVPHINPRRRVLTEICERDGITRKRLKALFRRARIESLHVSILGKTLIQGA